MNNYDIINLLIALGAILGLMWLIRAVVLWYFRIDKIVEQNDKIIFLLEKIADNTSRDEEG